MEMSTFGTPQPSNIQKKWQSKISAKYSVNELKNTLRQKFQKRIKDARSKVFQNTRDKNKNIDIEDFLRTELLELENNISLEDDIYNELICELNELLIQEMEDEVSYFVNIADSNDVICPVCQKVVLRCNQQIYSCSCGIKFLFEGSTVKLNKKLQAIINLHEQKCENKLRFFVEPQTDNINKLNGICQTCDYFYTI